MGRHLFLALLIFLFLSVAYAMATEIKVVSPSFSSQDFDVFIEINSSVELKGAQCDFSFNSSILQVEGIENGGMFELWGGDFNSSLPLVDNKNGTIREIIAFSIFNSSCNGTLAIIHFKSVAEGESELKIENALLSDKNANPVESAVKNASVVVDKSPPQIKNVKIELNDGKANITCDVSEEHIRFVKINVTYPDGKKKEYEMHESGEKYFLNESFEKGKYSFFIFAEDMAGNRGNSTIHQFTIKNHPPVKPYFPVPENGATNVAIKAKLSWECYDVDNDSIKYDVYFGTTSLQKVKSNITEKSYSPSLDYSTTYYWRIVAWDENGAKNESELWHFTTTPNNEPYVKIRSPGDNAVVSGQISVKGIAWDADGNDSVTKVEIRIDSSIWHVASGTNSWSYIIDTTKLSNGIHKIEARSYDGNLYSSIDSINIDVENRVTKYYLTVSVNPNNAGYVTKSPSRSKYEEGSIVVLTATPNNGYVFDHWGGDASGSNPTINIVMNGNKNVVANFVKVISPSIDFSFEPSLPYAGEEIKFYDKSSGATAWHWDFGDGNVATKQNPKHVYAKAGKYNVTLTVIIDGKEYMKKKSINVIGKEKADFSFYPNFPFPGSTVHFYAYGENIVSYNWDFGDESFAYGKNVSHVYGEGDYIVTLHIVDKWGNEDNKSKELHIHYPDFLISKISHEKRKGKVKINATIENTGGDAKGVIMAFYLNDEEIKRENVSIYHGNQSFEEYIPIKEGKNDIKIVIDATNKFMEKNESNNVASFIVYGSKGFSLNYFYLAIAAAFFAALISAYLLKFRKKEISIENAEQEARCTVCFGKFKPGSDIVRCECGAMFHKSCAERVKTCPICGRKLI